MHLQVHLDTGQENPVFVRKFLTTLSDYEPAGEPESADPLIIKPRPPRKRASETVNAAAPGPEIVQEPAEIVSVTLSHQDGEQVFTPEPEPLTPLSGSATDITIDVLRRAANPKIKANKAAVIELLTSYNVQVVTEIKKTQYKEFLEKLALIPS